MISTLCKASRTVNVIVVLWVASRSSTSQELSTRYQSNSGKYLANRRNKELLLEFLLLCWTRCDPGILGNVLLVLLHGDVCHSIVFAVTEVPDLFSDHEEADTRLLLHVPQTARVFSSVTIKSPDTYVMVL